MKFSEYIKSEIFQRKVSRRRIGKRTLFDLIVMPCLILLAVAVFLLLKFVPETVQREGWFIAVVTSFTFCVLAGVCVAEFLFFRGRNFRNESVDVVLGAGMLLLSREDPADMKRFIKENELVVPVRLGIKKNEVFSISFGEGEPSYDLAPFGGISVEGSLGIALLPVFDFLARTDVCSFPLGTVCLQLSASDGVREEEGEPLFLVKNGKWTLRGRMFRRDFMRTLKFLEKIGG